VQTKKQSASKVKTQPKALKKSPAVLPKKKPAGKKVAAKKVAAHTVASKVTVPPEFTMKQVKEIVALIKDAGTFTTFAYKTEEFEIEISVGAPSGPAAIYTPATQVTPVISAAPAYASTPVSVSAIPVLSASERLITSPMIGTFYRRPSPSAPPFVEVGDLVSPKTDVCIVEVMKLLNTIPAECSGKVSRILVEDGENIEAGQALMVIEVA
jgi:acetyl-CoA carboxylase biotin carboxyl carrier protein